MIESIFKDIIEEGRIEVNSGVYVSVDTFKKIFEGAETYNDFLAIDNEEKGYKLFFDRCKDQGILN